MIVTCLPSTRNAASRAVRRRSRNTGRSLRRTACWSSETTNSPSFGSITRARRKKAGVRRAEVAPIATPRGAASSASIWCPASLASAVVSDGCAASTGTETVGGSDRSRRSSPSRSSDCPGTLGRSMRARRDREPRFARLGGDASLELALQTLQLVGLEVVAQRHDSHLAEAGPPREPEPRPVAPAWSSASSMRGLAPRSAPVTVTVVRLASRCRTTGRSRCSRKVAPMAAAASVLVMPLTSVPPTNVFAGRSSRWERASTPAAASSNPTPTPTATRATNARRLPRARVAVDRYMQAMSASEARDPAGHRRWIVQSAI